VATPNSPQFRLTVWRPARLRRELAHQRTSQEPLLEGDVVEEAYVWEMPLDAWACLTESSDLHDNFRAAFTVDRPPSERTVNHLDAFVRRLEAVVAIEGASSWTATEEDSEDGDPPLTCDAARALAAHLGWVVSTFRHVPDSSVTIR
jgi:hypothetical protein